MPTALQNQLYRGLFGRRTPGVSQPGFLEEGTLQGAQQPGFPDQPTGMADMPVFQQGIPAQGGAFYGVQENAPASYASVPGFEGGRFSPAYAPRNPALDIAGLLGLGGKQFGGFDPAQQAALRQLFTTQEQLLGTLQNYGQGALQETEQGFQTRQNNLLANLAQRGLAGSTIASSVGTGIERERQQALNTLSDQLLGKKFDVLSGAGAGIANLLAGIGSLEQQARLQRQAQAAAQPSIGFRGTRMSAQQLLPENVFGRREASGIRG